jgi:hypothetical protein
MNEVVLEDWANFEAETSRILEEFQARKTAGKGYMSAPLFRGQADWRRPLATTLERFSAKAWSVKGYYRLLLSVAPAVTSLTSKAWPLDPDLEVDERWAGPPPGYGFMIYLRHHGFPSPLLDWSRSPYVAAFFALARRAEQPPPERAAVYAFVEQVGRGKSGLADAAHIVGLGSYAVTHERHYSQQSEYTVCKKRSGDSYVYCPHEEALRDGEDEQDILTKYVVPSSERGRFLRKLESMNIHAYSLFRDEVSLMETLAYREVERPDL